MQTTQIFLKEKNFNSFRKHLSYKSHVAKENANEDILMMTNERSHIAIKY